MKLRTILTSTSLCLVAHAAFAVDWVPAPLACLPNRAVKWDGKTQPVPPCHCPPADKCPETPPITTDAVSFIVEPENAGSYTLTGEQVLPAGFNPSDALSLSDEQVKEYISAAMLKVYNIDILHGCAGRDGYNGTGIIPNECIWSTKVTTNVGGWSPGELTMPVQLAERCCPNICPDGSTPQTRDVQVTEPRPPGEDVFALTPDEVDSYIAGLKQMRAAIDAEAAAAGCGAAADGGGGGAADGGGGGGAS